MKSTRRTLIRRAIIVAASFLTIAVLVAAALIPFQPPSHWSAITPGASREAVRAIIPEFDQPWGDVKADFEYEQRGPFTWRLACIMAGRSRSLGREGVVDIMAGAT